MFAKKYPGGLIPKLSKPDRDNYEKSIDDLLESCGVWSNDSCNWSCHTQKYYAERDTPAGRIEISIKLLQNLDKGVS